MTRMDRRGLTRVAALLLFAPLVLGSCHRAPPVAPASAPALARDVRILRDEWGVPHVFGKTDADAAFGLGYAQAEDDLTTLEDVLLAARGRVASVHGPDAAPIDFFVRLLRVWDVVDAKYESDLSPEVRAVCEAYAEGVNAYVAQHPDEALPDLFPARGQDLVAGFVFKVPFFFFLDEVAKGLFEAERAPAVSARNPLIAAGEFLGASRMRGSNAFAVAPSRSADRATRLVVNSHQPWEGPVAWYEAHVVSQQGWNMAGGTFPGAPLILLGHNEDLGWGSTLNEPDLIDLYRLTIDPENPNRYRYDGEWRDLDVRDAPIEVKLLGPISWTFHREALWSVYGPVLRLDHGTYAIRYAGMGDVRAVEQLFRMNKAHTFDAWQEAMRVQAMPSVNQLYADRTGTIHYVYNARFPVRSTAYDWTQVLPGDTSETLWTSEWGHDRDPQVTNPASGFLASANANPFRVTADPDNAKPELAPPMAGIETRMTNRQRRLVELLSADTSITAEELESIKFDLAYSQLSPMAEFVRAALEGPPAADPTLASALDLLRSWDLRTDARNPAAALAILAAHPTWRGALDPLAAASAPRDSVLAAARALLHTHGRIDPPWGDVNRLRRGDLDLPLDGGPDVVRAIEGDPLVDGRFTAHDGDGLVMFVTWDANGEVHSKSIHNYGAASTVPRSPHYADQAPLFARHEWKPVLLTEAQVRAHLEREYRPGQP
ncbi:MAG: acylase [bacterium]